MSKAPRRDLKDSQALGRSPATTSRKRRTLPQQRARRRGHLSPPPGDSFPAQQEISNRRAVPHAPPRARCNPPHLGLSSPSSPSRASPAWDGHPSELGRRSFPHPLRGSVGRSAPEGAAVSSRPIAQSSRWRGSLGLEPKCSKLARNRRENECSKPDPKTGPRPSQGPQILNYVLYIY